MNFDLLISQIEQTHSYLQQSAVNYVNLHVTMRNWLTGYYIVEFEQQGADRAVYGERLLEKMAEKLKHIKGLTKSELSRFRVFYTYYPDFFGTVSQILANDFNQKNLSILGTLSQESITTLRNNNQPANPPELLLKSISYSHFVELIKIQDAFKREFYETETIKGNWSVRYLRRQMSSLLYERTAMSEDKEKMLQNANKKAEINTIENTIRQPYIFEFLGLKDKDVVSETDLETALLDHLQEFILELGEGFCFEARQKRISFDTTYGRVDLVFYHRILKCHVLIELKVNDFDYSALTQLNTYVSYYRKNMMQDDDKPTIGILLCTGGDKLMVEYALAGLDEKIFVSRYLLYIPQKKVLENFIRNQLNKR